MYDCTRLNVSLASYVIRLIHYSDLTGILNITEMSDNMAILTKMKRLQLLPVNDNKSEAFQDNIGSGDRI